jgi:primary-amine oxidase
VHPLQPLSAAEIERAAGLIRSAEGFRPSMRFITISLREPPKEVVRGFRPGDPVERGAFAVLYDRERRATFECRVSLGAGEVRDWTHVADAQPLQLAEEYEACERAIRDDPRWADAIRARGIEDLGSVVIQPWCPGYVKPSDAPGDRRLILALFSVEAEPGDNHYARPVEGLSVLVDPDAGEVVEIEDSGPVPLPPYAGDYAAELRGRQVNWPRVDGVRSSQRPLEIVQPEGPSFELDGHALSWERWSLRVGFDAREGLILHQVGYEDGGRVRPVLYRASMSEMWVPYGDPGVNHYRKNVFDLGEGGFGLLANSLELGCDCLGEIRYLDGVVNDPDGGAVVKRNAICIHEEDVGIAWKHTDDRTGRVEVRRLRRLVISSISTIGNYEYGLYWHLYQDGAIECEIKLTGIIAVGAIAPGQRPAHGELVAPGLYGPHHQHFFSLRLDMEVDGPGNSVYEVDTEGLPAGPDNPWGNAWRTVETLLDRESAAQRCVSGERARHWKIVNPGALNGLGEPVAYKLLPGENVLPFHQHDAPALARAGFARRHLWVTRFEERELFAAGDYPYQHPGGAGLPEYAARDRALENADIVVWYTCGSHHIVRPEDWPIMPVAQIGFRLQPYGFFDGNPALDLPQPHHCHDGSSPE